MATNFGTKTDYNSALVKNNCALFSLRPLFSGPGYPMMSFKFFPCRLLLPWQRILGQNWLQLGPVKDNCSLFASTPLFSGQRYPIVSFNFSPLPTLVAMATNFGTKLTITRLPQKIIASCFHLPSIFGLGLCNGVINLSPEDLCCHGNQPFLFKDKSGCRLTRASNAETQLLGYIAWQWDRYLVPQNVFLVKNANIFIV